jgi:hypothetical protein
VDKYKPPSSNRTTCEPSDKKINPVLLSPVDVALADEPPRE